MTAIKVTARADDGVTWRIIEGSAGAFLEPPGSPLLDWEIIEGSINNPRSIMSLDAARDDTTAGWMPAPIRDEALRMLADADYRRTDGWERMVYGYFRNCYSPDGDERRADRLLIVGMDEPLYPGHPLVESGAVKLSQYSSLNKGPTVTADDARVKPEHHAGFLLVRKFFPDAEPRLDLIEATSGAGGYGARKCAKCDQTVQYEARVDGWAVYDTRTLDCAAGGHHDVGEA